MPWSGGVYTRGYPSWTNDANAGLAISATKFDTEDNDFASGLNNCMTIDGLNKPAANIIPTADNTYNLGSAGVRWGSIYGGYCQIGTPAGGSGTSMLVSSVANWQAATFQSTAQFTGPNKITNANQVVSTTQIMIHGLNAEFVSFGGSSGTDQKAWSNFADNSGNYNYRLENDALNATFTYDQIARTGNSGTFGSHQPIRTFSHGYGTVVFQSTISNGYQVVINAGGVAGFASGLQIIAGTTNGVDNALNIKNYNSSATLLNMTGQGVTTLGAVSASGLTGFSVTGLASNNVPVATFGGTASNFITVTDGAGLTVVMQAATGSAGILGTSSNTSLSLMTNNTGRITIAAAGGVSVVGNFACNGVTAGAAPTGYGTPTGGSHQGSFAAGSITLPNLAAAVAQLIIDLKSNYGFLAA